MVPIPKFKVNHLIEVSYHNLRSDKLILYALFAAAVILTAGFVLLFVKAGDLPSRVPLYYSMPWGEERLANASLLIILPVSALIMFVFNLCCMAFFYEKEPLLSKLLALASVFVSFLSVYTLIRIIFLIA